MKTIKKIASDLLGLVAGDAKVGEGTVQLGRALLSSGVTAAFLAATLVERHDGIAVLALFFPMVAAGIWAVIMWDNYLHGKPQAVEASEKDTPKNPSEASEVKEGRAQEPAVETPQAPETSTAEEAVEAGKENPVNKPQTSPSGDGEGEKATPEKAKQAIPSIEGLGGLRKSSPKEAAKKGRPEGEVDLAHEWPGVSEIISATGAVFKKHGVRGYWVSREDLEASLADYLGEIPEVAGEQLAAAPEGDRTAVLVLGGLFRQAFMVREALNSRISAAGKAARSSKDLECRAVLQGAIGSLQVAGEDVLAAGNLARRAAKALGCPKAVFALAVSRPETAFGVEESITFARNVIARFGAGKEQEASPEPPAPKPQPVAPPRVRHTKPALGDVKDTRKNQAADHQPAAEGEAPTLADLWPTMTGQGEGGHQ